MGWWSNDILGGDEPLDCLAHYQRATGVKELYPLGKLSAGDRVRIRSYIEDDPMRWLRIGTEAEDGWSKTVHVQVGAAIALTVGAKLPDEYVKPAVELILKDDWMSEDGVESARGQKIMKLVEQLRQNTGEPVEIEHKSLLAAISDRHARAGGLADWIEPVAIRIVDMIPLRDLDPEDRKKLQTALTRAFTLCPESIRPLIGTGVIEADYLETTADNK